MLSCLCYDLYEVEDVKELNRSHVYSTSGHLFIFRSQTHLSSFLTQNGLNHNDDLLFHIWIFEELSIGEHFLDYGFITDCGNYALFSDDVSIFQVLFGHTDERAMFMHQFDEHKVAAADGKPSLYVCAKNDGELISRTADAYRIVIAFISS